MKKMITLALTVMLVLGSMVPAVAAEGGSAVTISMDTIESVLLSNSLSMSQIKNNFDKADLSYRNAKSDYNDVKEQYDALVLDSPTAWAQALSLSKQLDALRSSMNSAKFNLDAATLMYDQQVMQFVLASKQQYLVYLSALAQKEIAENNLSIQESQLASLKVKLSKGYVSKKQVDQFALQVLDLQISQGSLGEQSAVLLEKLRSSIGIQETATVTVAPAATLDFTSISAIVFSDDLVKMLAVSTDIKTKEISLQSINKLASSSNDPSKYKYDILAAEIALAQTREQVKSDFKDQYLALKNSYASMQTKEARYTNKKAELAGMTLRYKFGFASAKQLRDLTLEVRSQELQLLIDRQSLYSSYIGYVLKREKGV